MKKKSLYSLIFLVVSIILLICSFLIKNNSYMIYSGILVFIAVIVSIFAMMPPKNEEGIYKDEMSRILKTYDAILSKIKDFPELKNRNVLSLNTIDDLVNAQSEIRKPIYYMEEMDSCIFFIVDDDNMIYFVLRKNDSSSNQIDEWAKLQQQKVKDKVISDSNLLDEIDKTTIVKLNNKKSFKVSPIREKENLKVQYTLQASGRDNSINDSNKVEKAENKTSEKKEVKKANVETKEVKKKEENKTNIEIKDEKSSKKSDVDTKKVSANKEPDLEVI